MTRIVSGFARSLALEVPSHGTRPTSDRVREALFSALDSRGALDAAHVLDLYAGSGALGLEAVSRGATRATLVESNPNAAAVCSRNARAIAQRAHSGTTPEISVRNQRVETFLARTVEHYDLVFIDPPYAVTNSTLYGVLEMVIPLLSSHSFVCVERSTRDGELLLPQELSTVVMRSYGETTLHYVELV